MTSQVPSFDNVEFMRERSNRANGSVQTSRGLVPIITPTTAIMIETPYKKNLYIKDGVINNNSPYLLLIILKNYKKKKTLYDIMEMIFGKSWAEFLHNISLNPINKSQTLQE